MADPGLLIDWLKTRPPRRIEAGKVVLERWRDSDVEALTATVNQSLEHLRPWMPWAAEPATVDGQRELVQNFAASWERGSDFVYGVFDPKGGGIIGGCGLHNRNGPGVLEIGYWIAVNHTHRGYATALTRGLAATALAMPEVRRVEIHCDEANHFSAAIPRRLGYRLDRIADRPKQAPAHSGRFMVWILDR